MHTKLIIPKPSYSDNETNTYLDKCIKTIACTINPEPKLNSEKYGTNYGNKKFTIHKYCWCDQNDCPWCGHCKCPEQVYTYFVKKKQVDFITYQKFYEEREHQFFYNNGIDIKEPNYHKKPEYRKILNKWLNNGFAEFTNKQRKFIKTPVCDYCLGKGIFNQPFCEPKWGAANFYYAPYDFKLWWYKYIGRDTETNKKLTKTKIYNMFEDCLIDLNM